MVDYKKQYKDLYQPKTPSIIDVPEMVFIMTDGKGDPNTSAEYANALELRWVIHPICRVRAVITRFI